MKLKLLVVTQYFWPENFIINDLVGELTQRGHEVTVLTGWPNYPEGVIDLDFRKSPNLYNWYQGSKITRVPVVPRGRGKVQLLINYVSFVLASCTLGVWKLRGCKFDKIFVYQTSPVTVAVPAILLKHLKGAKMVIWIQDLWPDTLKALGVLKSSRSIGILNYAVSYIYSKSDIILVQSKCFLPKVAERIGGRCKKFIYYVPNWSFLKHEIPSGCIEHKIPFKPNGFNIVYAGNIGNAQDISSILLAAKELSGHPNIRWILIGDGSARDWALEEVDKLNLREAVFFPGRIELRHMLNIFARSDALLITLKDEDIFNLTIPSKLQAYFSASRPILGMLNGEGASVLNEAKAGLVCSAGSFKGLAENALTLSRLPLSEREKMGENGKSFNNLVFERSKLIDEIEDILINLE